MKDAHNFPTSFVRFKAIKRYIKDESVRETLSHFNYRYRTARAFSGIISPDLEVRTINGYAVGIKLLLAFGAYDELRIARKSISSLRLQKGKHEKILDVDLAQKLRDNEKLKYFLTKTLKYKGDELGSDVKLFLKNENDDVLCIATSIRNAFAHGIYTPSSTGLTTKNAQKSIDDLANTLLDLTDRIATKCVDHFYKKYKGEK